MLSEKGYGVIRKCNDGEFSTIFGIINDSAQVHKNVIPAD
jgi:hypothetical protein